MEDSAVSSPIVSSDFFAFLLFWAPLCFVVGAKKYFFGALYKNSEVVDRNHCHGLKCDSVVLSSLVSEGVLAGFFAVQTNIDIYGVHKNVKFLRHL